MSFQKGDCYCEEFVPHKPNTNKKERENSSKSDISQIEKNFYAISTCDSNKENICKYVTDLKKKYMIAKSAANRIDACKQNIGKSLHLSSFK